MGKLKNIARAVVQRHGTAAMRTSLWNKEFREGHWDFIERTADDPIYPILEKYCNGGSILDLGCGAGNTGNELRAEAYNAYLGVDLSDVALEKAKHWSSRLQRSRKHRYAMGEISTFEPTGSFDVILFRESIFYIPVSRILNVLRRFSRSLSPGGAFIVRMCDRKKYAPISALIADRFQVDEEYLDSDTAAVILVFRPQNQVRPSA